MGGRWMAHAASGEPVAVAFRDQRRFREELHGVRGLAIFLVVVFHVVGNGRVSGGIDIFLAITGFLAVPSLMRRARAGGGRIPLMSRFAGLARRLLVPLIPVLVFVGVAGFVLLPTSRLPQLFAELRASALFFENYELVWSQLSYEAAGPATSPLQHLWSTSIQVQFHVVMPLLFMLVTVPAFRLRKDPTRLVIGILSVLTVVSFAYASWYQGVNQAENYFLTLSRTWQLTLPGIVGLLIPYFRLPSFVRGVFSWVGFGMICSSGFLFDGASLFPGPQALWPISGLLLVLIGGETRAWWGADRVLGLNPFQRLGDISYSLYLWHWPFIVFYLSHYQLERLWRRDAYVVLTLSLIFGYFGYRYLESGVSKARVFAGDKRAFFTIVAAACVVAFAATGVQMKVLEDIRREEEKVLAAAADPNYPGAQALFTDAEYPDMPWIPAPEAAHLDMQTIYKELPQNAEGLDLGSCRLDWESPITQPVYCEIGDPDSNKTVVLTGGSHVGQWSPAFEDMANALDWRYIVLERGACISTTDSTYPGGNEPDLQDVCYQWNKEALEFILDLEPTLVVTLATTQRGPGRTEIVASGARDFWSRLDEAGISTLLLRDTYVPRVSLTECLELEGDIDYCTLTDTSRYSQEITENGVTDLPELATYFDTAPLICPDGKCPPVIGNVTVWRNKDHITSTYARTTAPQIVGAIREAAPELFE
ncbi:MAG: acyltransferase family protein [Actinomycetaceae bacterium]|nr:acyltransferase family protein [Actinomycetaceae bacterium]